MALRKIALSRYISLGTKTVTIWAPLTEENPNLSQRQLICLETCTSTELSYETIPFSKYYFNRNRNQEILAAREYRHGNHKTRKIILMEIND